MATKELCLWCGSFSPSSLDCNREDCAEVRSSDCCGRLIRYEPYRVDPDGNVICKECDGK